MAAPQQSTNSSLIPLSSAQKDPVGMRFFITAREKTIKRIEEELQEEEERTKECDDAIADLEAAIPEGKESRKMREENVANLLAVQARVKERVILSHSSSSSRGSRSEALQRFRSQIASPTSLVPGSLDDQISDLRKELEWIRNSIVELEQELDKWWHLRALSTATIEYLTTMKAKEEESLTKAQSNDTPKKSIGYSDSKSQVPDTIWAKIFKLVLDAEYYDYTKNTPKIPLRPLVYVLSHVCRSWYTIVHDTAQLWTIAYAPPSSNWKEHEKILLTLDIQKSRIPITVISNLSQANGLLSQPASVQTSDGLFSGKPYTLHITMTDDHEFYMQKLLNLQFHQANSLIISASDPLKYGHFFQNVYNHGFKSITSLTIINDLPTILQPVNMGEIFPCLTTLTFRFKEFPTGSFSLLGYLPSTLQALYIHSDCKLRMPSLGGISLPALHTLGICSNGLGFLRMVPMPSITRLVLYGPNDPNEKVDGVYDSWKIFEQITHLELKSWAIIGKEDPNVGIVCVIRRLPRRRAFKCVRFTDCFIDGPRLVEICTVYSSDKKLTKRLILDHSTGITREQCEKIRQFVGKLEIHA